MTNPDRLLVIGVGNRDRGDDAVGPIVCDLVEQLGIPYVDTLVFEGSVLDLPVHWSTDDRVLLVDAAAPVDEPGRVEVTDGVVDRLTSPSAVSTHTIDVSAAIELARALDRMPAELTIIGIEGAVFEFGAPLTPAVEQAAHAVVAELGRH
jgi:hydrogenase maturation protease